MTFRPLDALRAVRDDPGLSTTAKMLAVALILRSDDEGRSFPSLSTLSGDAGCSRRTVVKTLPLLCGHQGELRVARQKRRRGARGWDQNAYQLTLVGGERGALGNHVHHESGEPGAPSREPGAPSREPGAPQVGNDVPQGGELGSPSREPGALGWGTRFPSVGNQVPSGREPGAHYLPIDLPTELPSEAGARVCTREAGDGDNLEVDPKAAAMADALRQHLPVIYDPDETATTLLGVAPLHAEAWWLAESIRQGAAELGSAAPEDIVRRKLRVFIKNTHRAPKVHDDGPRSEAEHLAQKQREADRYKREFEQEKRDRARAVPVGEAAKELLAAIGTPS